MSIVDKLREKIDSKEQWQELVRREGLKYIRNLVDPTTGDAVRCPWWLERETARIEHEVYTQTEVLYSLNQSRPWNAVHVSNEDPGLVAYTPDAVAGEKDKQLKIALGRFITKYYPYLPDDVVQQAVAAHHAELATDIEFIRGGEAIAAAYDLATAKSCMSHKGWATHPCAVYDAPDIALAVLRDGKGNINARCLVYTPTEYDKRLIRSYGDTKLLRLLTRKGFKPGTWHGATFKAIRRRDDTYVFPYLDGEGAAGSVERSAIAMIDGQIRSIPEETYTKLLSINQTWATTAMGTAGYISLVNVDSKEFIRKCPLTGEDMNLLTDSAVTLFKGGERLLVKRAPPDAVKVRYYTPDDMYRAKEILATADTPTFTYRDYLYLDEHFTRRKCGYVELNPTFYGPHAWANSRYDVVFEERDSQGREYALKDEDAIKVLDGTGHAIWKHKSAFDSSWEKVHSPHRGEKLYCMEPSAVKTTVTGRRVVVGFHDIEKTWDGRWAFSRSTKSFHAFGRHWVYLKEEGRPDIHAKSPLVQAWLTEEYESQETEKDWYRWGLGYFDSVSYHRLRVGDEYRYIHQWVDTETNHKKVFDAMADNLGYMSEVAAMKHWIEVRVAEASGLEAPNHLEELATPEVPETAEELETV